MSTASSTYSTIALFGGTAGTGLSFLNQYLTSTPSGFINVLARTPSKLSYLEAQYPKRLELIKGDIRSSDALKTCLVRDGRLVDIVVSSIGMGMKLSGIHWVGTDPTICHDGTSAILTALENLEADPTILKPASGSRTKIVVLSTTGISEKGRDIPIAMIPLYHWMLKEPHVDKRAMEKVVEASGREWVAVRPSFLVDGQVKGLGSVKSSVEGTGVTDGYVAVGYGIAREDVARWILEKCVLSGEEGFTMWEGKKVTITY